MLDVLFAVVLFILSDHMTCCVVVGCDASWTITGEGSTAGCNPG